MKRIDALKSALWVFALVAGCNNQGGPIPFEDFASASAEAACASASRCGTVRVYEQLLRQEVTDCPEQLARISTLAGTFDRFEASIDAGRLAYDPNKARECVNEYESAECDDILAFQSCREAFRGLVPPGGECSATFDCVSTSRCMGASDNGCTLGRCEHVPQLGEPCTSFCADEAFCDTDSSTCVLRREQGAACTNSECAAFLTCREGVCAGPPTEGEACTWTCASNLICATNAEGARTCRRPRTDGTCQTFQDCPIDQHCNRASPEAAEGTCGAYPTLGQRCEFACARGSYCDGSNNTCVAISEPVAIGGACEVDRECATGRCDEGICAARVLCE